MSEGYYYALLATTVSNAPKTIFQMPSPKHTHERGMHRLRYMFLLGSHIQCSWCDWIYISKWKI